jgi:hypothetical protein
MSETITVDQVKQWAVDPETHKEQLIRAFDEDDPKIKEEVVKVWTGNPLVFFAQLQLILEEGERQYQEIVNDLLLRSDSQKTYY